MTGHEGDRRGLRAGDADREAVVEILRDAAAEGRLSLEEMGERQDSAYAARTFAELEPLVADLPDAVLPWAARGATPVVRGGGVPASADEPLVITAGGSNQARRGRWRVPTRLTLQPQMATVVLDFREALCPAVVDIEVKGGMGNVTLVVPEGWHVDADRLSSSWGTVRNKRAAPPERGAPTLVVHGGIGMGTFRARGPLFYERRGTAGPA